MFFPTPQYFVGLEVFRDSSITINITKVQFPSILMTQQIKILFVGKKIIFKIYPYFKHSKNSTEFSMKSKYLQYTVSLPQDTGFIW